MVHVFYLKNLLLLCITFNWVKLDWIQLDDKYQPGYNLI